jgi:hypothetical protein
MYTKSRKSQAKSSVENKNSGWEGAIAFTKAKIKELKKALAGLQAARKRGDQWPGTQSERQTA